MPFNRREFLRILGLSSAGALGAMALRSSPLTSLPALAAPDDPLALDLASKRIKHVIIFLQENRTFDSLFAGFPGADSKFANHPCPEALPADPPHQHKDALVPNGATTAYANCSYEPGDTPNYWRLARAFTLCDRFFSDIRGPSHPNYLMVTAAQSPIVNTPTNGDECPELCFDIPTITQRLDRNGISWRDYGGIVTDIKSLVGRSEIKDFKDAAFFRSAGNGTLPGVSWLNSGFLKNGDELSGHPPAPLCQAENYMVKVLNAVMASPQWESTALFLWWDDWGGFYDHVNPPTIENWTDGTPLRYGFRVPCIVVSPYAKQHNVSHTVYSQVSILRFIEKIFGLRPLNSRDGTANDMLDCFNFGQAPRKPFQMKPRMCED